MRRNRQRWKELWALLQASGEEELETLINESSLKGALDTLVKPANLSIDRDGESRGAAAARDEVHRIIPEINHGPRGPYAPRPV